jgi:hypothetical protein
MNHRLLGWLSAASLATTVIWLILLIMSLASAGPLQTFEQVLAVTSRLTPLYYLSYTNAALTVITAAALFAGLYRYLQPAAPEWSAIGLVFVPVYAVVNLIVYLSQISLVPNLIAMAHSADTQSMATFLLRQWLQQSPGSMISFLNNLAYAILGIPSIIFGLLLGAVNPRLRLAGLLLAANGVACILGVIGILLNINALSSGSLIGGVLYLAALILLSWILLSRGPVSRSNGKEHQSLRSRSGQTSKK